MNHTCLRCGYPKAIRAPWKVVDGPIVAIRWICRVCKLSWTISNYTGTIHYWPMKRKAHVAYPSKQAPIRCLLVLSSKEIL
jgi:hypothetical protein